MIPEFRVSNVELFRGWLKSEEDDFGWLIRQLASSEPTDAMLRGTAFHKALEIAREGTVDRVDLDGYTFLFDIDATLALPETREVRLSKNYGGIVVSGQVDCIFGNTIIDHKSTSHFDAERYNEGYQWRYYLDIFRANLFRWNVFEMKEVEIGTWAVTALHVMEQYRYPSMEQDCRDLAHKLRDFAAIHMRSLRQGAA